MVNQVRKKSRAPGLGFNALDYDRGPRERHRTHHPLGYIPDGDDYLTVASNRGTQKNPRLVL
jgi:hypothetical protein